MAIRRSDPTLPINAPDLEMAVVTECKGAPVRLMRTSILFYLTLAFTGALIANPIAIDSEKRFYHMTAEKVIVNVKSVVKYVSTYLRV